MKTVTKEAFFARINPLNVHPKTDLASLKTRYHVSVWETPTRQIVGRSTRDSHGIEPTKFELT